MPKLGLKHFIGSFLLSLAAVFVAAKAYVVMTLSEQENEKIIASVEARKIELFAANEENDPIYEKYKMLTQQKSEPVQDDVLSLTDMEDDILYDSETQAEALPAKEKSSEQIVAQSTENDESMTVEQKDFEVSDSKTVPTDIADDLQIADASDAPTFIIPLKHNYNTEQDNAVTVAASADTGKIALASHDVSIYNLGTENQASVTDPLEVEKTQNAEAKDDSQSVSTDKSSTLTADVSVPQMEDDPWEVAETANKYAPKNSLSTKSEAENAEVALPAQEAEVAYKMQKNILIPIPEDIMNEENLTPQFSTSKENLKLEEELRAKHELPTLDSSDATEIDSSESKSDKPVIAPHSDENTDKPKIEIRPMPAQIPSDDTEKDFDDLENEAKADEQTSKNLTDSVAAWFSGIKTKVSGIGTGTASKTTDSAQASKQNTSSGNGSIFQRLLGSKEEEKNIAPSELKITFQPNKADISGQTLEWLRAFADNTLENDNVVVEIRASQLTTPVIQQKRLRLMYKVLADKGVDYRKVNVIFTNREPNSFIIRNVRYASEEELARSVAKLGDNPW